ncbi:MAG TPA: penicillin-binding transpeptidase domain-containing protein [bacterium]|nr:penicillin-binding transpeptidase domain-containing protein [bacterium]
MKREKRIFGAFAALVGIFFLVVLYRTYHIQIQRHEELDRYSSSSEVVKKIKARRGAIYDRNGAVLAISEPRVDLAVDPNGIKMKKEMAAFLAREAGLNESEVFRTLGKKSNFRYLRKNVPYETVRAVYEERTATAARLRELERRRGRDDADESERRRLARWGADLNYVILVDGFNRIYPQGKMLSNVLGWVSKESGEGLGGIESSFNRYLSGGELQVRRLYIPGSGEGALEIDKELESGQAGDIYLTIDSAIQAIAEEELDRMLEKKPALWGGAVVMDPATGRILAMANSPGFDPEEYQKVPLDKRRNYAISSLFEPGSTMKAFTILAAMNEDLVRDGEMFNGHNGVFKFGGRLINDHDKRGLMTLEEVVVYSSNIGTVLIVDRLPAEKMHDYLVRFGFNERSGVQLPGESFKAIRPYQRWFPIGKANIAFGQGLLVNMVQMARAMSALVNGGVFWQPTIVDRIVDPATGRPLLDLVPSFTRMDLRHNVDKKMLAMLRAVVTKGTGGASQLKGIPVGGKTGTSQKYDPVKKAYSKEASVCSFLGFAPADNPKLVIMVVIDEPKGREFGGTVAAPVFREIARRVLPLFGVYGEKDAKEIAPFPRMAAEEALAPITGGAEGVEEVSALEVVAIPVTEGMPVARAVYTLNQAGLDVVVSGSASGTVKRQFPKGGDSVLYGTSVVIESDESMEEEE